MSGPERGAPIQPLPRVTLVIPCYNERARLPVATLEAWLRESPANRLVLVDDGSNDGTVDLLRALRSRVPEAVTVIELATNRGKAEAVRSGMTLALSEEDAVVAYWDADLATPLDEVEGFIAALQRLPSCDIVLGSRVKLLGRRIERRRTRHYIGRVFATLASFVLHLPVYDTQCGAKMFRANERTRALFIDPFISPWLFDVELLARYGELVGGVDPADVRIVEYPLRQWSDVPGSKLTLASAVRSIVDLARIALKY